MWRGLVARIGLCPVQWRAATSLGGPTATAVGRMTWGRALSDTAQKQRGRKRATKTPKTSDRLPKLGPYSKTVSGVHGERSRAVKWWRVGEEHAGLRVEAFVARQCPRLAPISNVAALLRRKVVSLGPAPARRPANSVLSNATEAIDGKEGAGWRALAPAKAEQAPEIEQRWAKFGDRLKAGAYIHLNLDVALGERENVRTSGEEGKRETGRRSGEGEGERGREGDGGEERGKKAERMKELIPDYTKKEIRSSVLYKDAHFLAINKPVGLAVQGDGVDLVSLLPYLQHFDDDTVTAEEQPRLVHRLDKHTSGVLLLARNRRAASHLGALFTAQGRVKKTYWAVVSKRPDPPEGRVRQPLKKTKFLGGDKTVPADFDDAEAQKAITEYYTLGYTGNIAVLGLEPMTGRSHQLRVHCASALEAPILGDVKYGPGVPEELEHLFGRKMDMHLHAKEIRFQGAGGKQLHITAPLPLHWRKTLRKLQLTEHACMELQELRSNYSEEALAATAPKRAKKKKLRGSRRERGTTGRVRQ